MQYQIVLFVISCMLQMSVTLYPDNDIQTRNSSQLLSRKKRYLIFPDGSSLQLVYCLTIPTYGMGKIFTIGLTAALAWELPHDPEHFKILKQTIEKRVDKPINKPTAPMIHSPQYHYITNQWLRPYLDRKVETTSVPEYNWLPAYRNRDLYRKHGAVHRRTRRELFSKIEKFFDAQNKDGKACLLKALCEVNQSNNSKKGTFVQEVIRAIFTWLPGEDPEHMYDEASGHRGNCTEKFPTCSQSVWNPFF